MDIYATLKADHKEVKALLKEMVKTEETDARKREKMLKQLKALVVPHARAEEIVLYDRLKNSEVKEADSMAFENYEEHAVVDRLMVELETTPPNDKKWTALISVVQESLLHHIKEEEDQTFEKAKKSFDRQTATVMAEEFEKLKEGFLDEVKAGKTPRQKPSHELVVAA